MLEDIIKSKKEKQDKVELLGNVEKVAEAQKETSQLLVDIAVGIDEANDHLEATHKLTKEIANKEYPVEFPTVQKIEEVNPVTEVSVKNFPEHQDIKTPLDKLGQKLDKLIPPDIQKSKLEKGEKDKPQYVVPIDEKGNLINFQQGTNLFGRRGGVDPVGLKTAAGVTINPAEEDGNLADIKTNTDNIPPLGQALAAASVPVILPAATITTLTPPAAITGFALEAGNLNLIATAQTDGSQKTQIVDAAGNVPTTNALNPAPTDRGLVSRNLKVEYAIQIDEASSTITYAGYAAVGTATSAASWRIKRISISGTVTSITFADGDANYNNIWDNRAALSYS